MYIDMHFNRSMQSSRIWKRKGEKSEEKRREKPDESQQSMDDLSDAEAGGTETRDDYCVPLGDDDCHIVEDAQFL